MTEVISAMKNLEQKKKIFENKKKKKCLESASHTTHWQTVLIARTD